MGHRVEFPQREGPCSAARPTVTTAAPSVARTEVTWTAGVAPAGPSARTASEPVGSGGSLTWTSSDGFPVATPAICVPTPATAGSVDLTPEFASIWGSSARSEYGHETLSAESKAKWPLSVLLSSNGVNFSSSNRVQVPGARARVLAPRRSRLRGTVRGSAVAPGEGVRRAGSEDGRG